MSFGRTFENIFLFFLFFYPVAARSLNLTDLYESIYLQFLNRFTSGQKPDSPERKKTNKVSAKESIYYDATRLTMILYGSF